jgi:hypothetical protein
MKKVTRVLCAAMAMCGAGIAAADPPGSAAASQPATAAATGAQQPAAPLAASETSQRLLFSADGGTLTGDHGAGGGSATWLANFAGGEVLGLGLEYQSVADSHWTLGNFNGSVGLGHGTTLYAEAHEGSGQNAGESFRYTNLAGGFISKITAWMSVQLEERYLDIDKDYGHLPKVGLNLHLSKPLLLSLSYAHSFGGNLGTKLGTARLDYYGPGFNWLVGGAYGPVAPAVVNLVGQVLAPAETLREGFIGVGKTFGRTDWQLIGDYQDLPSLRRTTITLNCTWHIAGGHLQ